MSLGSGFIENIPHFTFTPMEHQVECVRMAEFKNLAYVLGNPQEKSFIVLMLIKEHANFIRSNQGKGLILLYNKPQVSLWANFLSRMTDLRVVQIQEYVEVDTGQLIDSGGVLVTTYSSMAKIIARKLLFMDNLKLIVADNVQAALGSSELTEILSAYHQVPRNRAPRFVAFTPNILTSNVETTLGDLPKQLETLDKKLPANVDCACDIATQLRFLARPREVMVLYDRSMDLEPYLPPFFHPTEDEALTKGAGRSNEQQLDVSDELEEVESSGTEEEDEVIDPETQIRQLMASLEGFLRDQNYSLYDTYGDEFSDLIADIPDPTKAPLEIIQDFLGVLDEFGLWCADRAALVLMIKIDKLKMREKYERHFLLLSVLFSLMVQVRKICDDFFGEMPDYERIFKYSRPKMRRLIEVLSNYCPPYLLEPPRSRKNSKDGIDTESKSSDSGHDSSGGEPAANQISPAEPVEATRDDSDVAEDDQQAAPGVVNHVNNDDKSHQEGEVRTSTPYCEEDTEQTSKPVNYTDSLSVDPANDSAEKSSSSEESKHIASGDAADIAKVAAEVVAAKSIGRMNTGGRGFGRRAAHLANRKHGPLNPEDPEAICGLVIVDNPFHAKMIYHFLRDLSRCKREFSFISPQYVINETGSKDPKDLENERKKQEEALKRFRVRDCNVLVSSSVLEEGIDFVKCNLVLIMDDPISFRRYVYSKIKCKSVYGSLVYLADSNPDVQRRLMHDIGKYKNIESVILSRCSNQAASQLEDEEADRYLDPLFPLIGSESWPGVTVLSLNNAVLVLNRYCAKLPSDTFTRLIPSWTIERTHDEKFYCALFLPINSPLKELIVGPCMPSSVLALRACAYTACIKLYRFGELDNNMMPVGKESLVPVQKEDPQQFTISEDFIRPGTTKRRQYYYKQVSSSLSGVRQLNSELQMAECGRILLQLSLQSPLRVKSRIVHDENPIVDEETRKREELLVSFPNIKYYTEEEDPVLVDRYKDVKVKDGELGIFNLYCLKMDLACPIPEEQNTRGRKVYDPADSVQLFGMLLPNTMPAVPPFPIYTRSGEVLVSVEVVSRNISLTKEQLLAIYTFHIFIFYSVLRLEKYPMVFDASSEHNCAIFVPLQRDSFTIDWKFLDLIKYLSTKRLKTLGDLERQQFNFRSSDYTDAVIMPWYRNQDQPQYFYVAEICNHLNPTSDFPGQGFETFEKYYGSKYGISIQNRDQPLLDVDHTSARLNFLTPRYVNRKGIALPTSSEETKRNKRENLDQKQILVPELCAIHPFTASLWRQTVGLPCVLYRLNALLIADHIRFKVATEMKLGLPKLPEGEKWPNLNFGWTLADVVSKTKLALNCNNPVEKQESKESADAAKNDDDKDSQSSGKVGDLEDDGECGDDEGEEWEGNEEVMGRMADRLISRLAAEERSNRKKKLKIGTWSNDMAAQTGSAGSGTDGTKHSSQKSQRKDNTGGWEASEDDEDDDLMGIELPDNLTFLPSSAKVSGIKRSSTVAKEDDFKHTIDVDSDSDCKADNDWGTGIQTKQFRVGSPTFFSQNENGMAGLMDDLEGFSCTDSDEDWMADNASETDDEPPGGTRIEFHGDNLAETIEEENATAAREEMQARDRDQEERMVANVAWDPQSVLIGSNKKPKELELDVEVNVDVKPKSHLDIVEPDVRVTQLKPKFLKEHSKGNINASKKIQCQKKDSNADEACNVQKVVDSEIDLLLSASKDRQIVVAVKQRLARGGELKREDLVLLTQATDNDLDVEASIEALLEIDSNKSHIDLEIVLTHLSLSPDLSLLNAKRFQSTVSDSGVWGVIPWKDVDGEMQDFSFDHQPELSNHSGPSPSLILQALTMSNSNDAINLERLETIGDSFLKYAITTYLFCEHPLIHEGKLSHLRSKQVSNLNLYTLGRSRGLAQCMIATKFEPHDNWLPPCYHVPRELEQALIESGVPASHWNVAELSTVNKMDAEGICQLLRRKVENKEESLAEEDDIERLPSFVPYNLLTQHSIPDKSIADCVEALIGAYLISCGPRGALLFMTWLGITVLPGPREEPGVLAAPPSPLLRTPAVPDPERHLIYLVDGFSKFEQMIGYVWRDKSYLLQAFSHASYYPNRLTDCYQRLEFLGDAVLDYLITRHLYEDPRQHSPGALTDLRSALVNNTIFASLAVRHQFHKFFKHLSPGLQHVCDRFVRIQAENGWKVSEECYFIEEDDAEEAEDIEVPKALGDVFESVAGSIYLDSGLSLDAVWKVYYRMMRDEIEQFSSHVPKSPIRELLELEPETAKFSKPEKLADGRRVRVAVEVFGKGVFKGIGRNYRIAKCTAAKCALKALRKSENRKGKK